PDRDHDQRRPRRHADQRHCQRHQQRGRRGRADVSELAGELRVADRGGAARQSRETKPDAADRRHTARDHLQQPQDDELLRRGHACADQALRPDEHRQRAAQPWLRGDQLERRVSAATSAVAAATVPLVAPCRKRRTNSSVGFWTRKISPTVIPPPSIERKSIGLRPNRSPSTPQMGLATAIESPETLAEAAVHRSSSLPAGTPRSWCRKIDRNGNAKLNPKIAVNSANHSAARLRRQSTPPALMGGTVARGSFARAKNREWRRSGRR